MARKTKDHLTTKSLAWLHAMHGSHVNISRLADNLKRKDGKPFHTSTIRTWVRKYNLKVKPDPAHRGLLLKVTGQVIELCEQWYPIERKKKLVARVTVTKEEAQKADFSDLGLPPKNSTVKAQEPQADGQQQELGFPDVERLKPQNRFLVLTPQPTLFTDEDGSLYVVMKVLRKSTKPGTHKVQHQVRWCLTPLNPDLASTKPSGRAFHDTLEGATEGFTPVPLGAVVYIEHYGCSL